MGIRRTCTVLVLASLSVTAIGITPSSAATTVETRAFRLINASREDAGRAPLKRNARLDEIAESHSIRMRREGTIFHNRNLPNQVPGDWKLCGENVGYGGTVVYLHKLFMRSESHRANILRAAWDQVGIGIVSSGDGILYETQVFVDR